MDEQIKKLERVISQRVIKVMSEKKHFSYPVLVCTRDALMVALKGDYENFNRDAIAFARRNRNSLTQTIRNMTLARPAICKSMKTRVEEAEKEGQKQPIIDAISNGLQAKLCGYDTAIVIMICAVIGGKNSTWNALRKKFTDSDNDIVLASWELYTKERLLINKHEDSRPLLFGFPL